MSGVPDQLRQRIDEAVSRSLSAEFDARGLVLSRTASALAMSNAEGLGSELVRRMVAHCYQSSAQHDRAVNVEFDDDQAAARIGLALAFGSVTASLLTPQQHPSRPAGSVDLLCAVFNLGIGMVDGLCDGAPHLGRQLLLALQAVDLSGATRERGLCDQVRLAIPAMLASDPAVAFTTRIIEAFFELLHSSYPGDEGLPLRDQVGAKLEQALAAESQSVGLSVGGASLDRLTESSRRTSVLPFQIIEHLATGNPALSPADAGTLLGEAMWRIDDLVDLAQDASQGALNAVLLAAGAAWPAAAQDRVAALERLLRSPAIALAAARAAEHLDAGLEAAPGGAAVDKYRRLFLSFIHRYSGITSADEVRFRS